MPAILRIFSYQTDASQSVIGSCQSYGVIVVQGVDLREHVGLEHYKVSNLNLLE